MAGCYEHSNETLGIIKGRELLDLLNECCLIHGVDYLRDCNFLMKYSFLSV